MGMYDSVFATCTCGTRIQFQSKAGTCELKKYHSTSVPAEIAAELARDCQRGIEPVSCHRCSKRWNLDASIPRIAMVLRAWRDPDADDPDEEWDGETYD